MRTHVIWISVGALLLSSVLASTGAARPLASKQRIAIDKKLAPPGDHGSFRLTARTKGTLGDDAGTWTYVEVYTSQGVRDGQAYTHTLGKSTFEGKRGSLVLRDDETAVEISPGLRSIGIGTWKVVKGTGAYKGVTGGGRMAGWYIRTGQSLERYDGYLEAKGGS